MGLLNHGQKPNKGNAVQTPFKVGVTSMRREVFNEEGNDDQLNMNLDCRDEVRIEASQRIAKYQ